MNRMLIDRCGLDLNRLIVEKIRQRPELMDLVREKLDRTLADPRFPDSGKDALREWQTIFSLKSSEQILEILVEDSEEGRRRRQSTPFTGILSQREREEVFQRYKSSEN